MQEISVLGLVASSLAATKAPAKPEPQLFEGAFLPRSLCWRGLFMSAALHCFCIFVLVPLLPESEGQAWRRYARAYRPLEIQIPERLYLSPTEPEPPRPRPESKPQEKPESPAEELAKTESPAPPLTAQMNRVLPRQFRLPKVPRKSDADLTLIQPHLPPDLALKAQAKLPQLMLSSPTLPGPPSRRFVEPGRSAPEVVAPKLDGPPALAAASEAPSDLGIPSMLTGPEDALLHLPRPTIAARAFRAPSSTASGHGTSVSPTMGEPINVLAISANPAPLQERVTIPVGNQIGRLPPPPPSVGATGPPGMPASAAGKAGSVAGTGGGGKAAGSGAGGSSTAGGSGAGGDGPVATAQSRGPGIASSTPWAAINYTTPIRIEHPTNAVFDVVVVQSSADEGFPESAGVLTGQPVYTVYLQVGAPKAWILQYCLPKDTGQNPIVVGGAVYIGKPAPLKAPYPLLTVLPPVTAAPRTRYIMVHGFLDKGGQFKDLDVLRAPDDHVKEFLLPQLAEWQFRPATRDGVPVLIEVLLAIPPHEG